MRNLLADFRYALRGLVAHPAFSITAILTLDNDLEANNVESMPQLMSRKLRAPRFQLLLLLTFSATALALAAIGTYGLFAYAVSRRMRELGIRMALGAEQRQILGSVIGDALRLAGFGVLLGGVSSILLVRVMHGMIAGVSPFDPLSIVGSAVLLVMVAALACLGPALRASRVDPIVTLAAE